MFLTDDDLANFESHQGVLALVVAGGRAGFFVREPDGSVQAIRSHEEFKVADAASRPSVETNAAAELPLPLSRVVAGKAGLEADCGMCRVPGGSRRRVRLLAAFLPHMPIALAIREEAGNW